MKSYGTGLNIKTTLNHWKGAQQATEKSRTELTFNNQPTCQDDRVENSHKTNAQEDQHGHLGVVYVDQYSDVSDIATSTLW